MLQLQKIHLPEKTNKQTTSLPFSSILHPDCNTDKYFLCLELFRFVRRKKKVSSNFWPADGSISSNYELLAWRRETTEITEGNKKTSSAKSSIQRKISQSQLWKKKWPTVYHTKVFLTAVKINLSLPLSTSYWHRVMPRNNFDCFFFVLFSFKHK